LISDRVCGHACWHEILRYDGNEGSFQTVHSIRHSCLQTLKAAGKSHLHRFEHNHNLGELESSPELDLSIYEAIPEAQQI